MRLRQLGVNAMNHCRCLILLIMPMMLNAQVGAAVGAAFASGVLNAGAREFQPKQLFELPRGERLSAFNALPGGGLRVASRVDDAGITERVLMPDAAMVFTIARACAPLYARAGEGVLIRCGGTAYFRHAPTGRIFSYGMTDDTARIWWSRGSVYIARPDGGGSWQIEPDGSAWRTDELPPAATPPAPDRLRLEEHGLVLERGDGKGIKNLIDAEGAKSIEHYGWIGEKWIWAQTPGGIVFFDPMRGRRLDKLPGRFRESEQAGLVPLQLTTGDRGFAFPKGADRVMWLTQMGDDQSGYTLVEFNPAPGVVLDAPPAPAPTPASAPAAP